MLNHIFVILYMFSSHKSASLDHFAMSRIPVLMSQHQRTMLFSVWVRPFIGMPLLAKTDIKQIVLVS